MIHTINDMAAFALAAALVVGSVSMAQAYEKRAASNNGSDAFAQTRPQTPANRRGDRSRGNSRSRSSADPYRCMPHFNGAGQQVGPYCFEN